MKKVCFLDDDVFSREVVTTVLASHDIMVLSVATEHQLIMLSMQHTFDVLIFDVHLMRSNSIDIAERFRQHGLTEFIIFYTADMSNAILSRVSKIPNCAIVEKGDVVELISAVVNAPRSRFSTSP